MVSLTTPTAADTKAAPPAPQTAGANANALSLLSFMDIKILLQKLTNY